MSLVVVADGVDGVELDVGDDEERGVHVGIFKR